MKQLRLTDQELEALAADIESDRVERKERLTGDVPNKIREAICAFANDMPGHGKPGVVLVGLDDAGKPIGLTISDELLVRLADMRSDGNIVPIPTLSVEKRQVFGSDVAVVTVEPSDAPPVRYKGRIYIRVGSRRDLASRQDERILNERRLHNEQPYDLMPVRNATVDELALPFFSEVYLPGCVAADVLARNNRTVVEQLLATKMIAEEDVEYPTVTGLLVLGRRPRHFFPCAYIQFLRIGGTTLSDPIQDAEEYDGPVDKLYERVMTKLRAYRMVAVEIVSGGERRTESVSLIALEQLLANAIMHRTYEGTNAPIRITWFNDRVEIRSPGGPYGTVTVERFGKPGMADYRNPNLAAAMKNLGIVQRFGVGIGLAVTALAEGGFPPLTWDVDSHSVCATVWTRK